MFLTRLQQNQQNWNNCGSFKVDYDSKVYLIRCLSCIRPALFLNPCLSGHLVYTQSRPPSFLLPCLLSLCVLTFLIFASYVTQNTGAKPKVHPDSGSLPEAGGLACGGKSGTLTCLAKNRLSWESVLHQSERECLPLTSGSEASAFHFLAFSENLLMLGALISCFTQVTSGTPEFVKGSSPQVQV